MVALQTHTPPAKHEAAAPELLALYPALAQLPDVPRGQTQVSRSAATWCWPPA